MSNANIRLPHAQARVLANRVLEVVNPFCQRAEIVGSLRRGCETIGDIDILVIPNADLGRPVFGRPATGSAALRLRYELARWGANIITGGWKAIYVTIDGTEVDLWLADDKTWGCKMVIRTGCAEFSYWLVSARPAGALPVGMRFKENRLWRDGQMCETPEETDVFREMGLAYVPPEERETPYWQTWRPA